VLVLGSTLVLIGLAALWLILLTVAPTDLTSWTLLGPLAIAGVGNGFFIAPNARFIVATVDNAEAGAASGVVGTMQRVGSAIGIAVVSSVLFGVANLAGLADEIKTKVAAALAAGTYTSPEEAGAAISQAALAAHFGEAATVALLVSALFALASVALVFVLPKRVNLH